MADGGNTECPCSNITIMQLFHELKQRYPGVPDQIVSKVMQENFHDKDACEEVLEKENRTYLQSYPGSLISGQERDGSERKSLASYCRNSKMSPKEVSGDKRWLPNNNKGDDVETSAEEKTFFFPSENCIYSKSPIGERRAFGDRKKSFKSLEKNVNQSTVFPVSGTDEETGKCNAKTLKVDVLGNQGSTDFQWIDSGGFVSSSRLDPGKHAFETNVPASHRTSCQGCSGNKCDFSERSQFQKWGNNFNETIEKLPGCLPVHNYQVAVQYSMEPRPVRPNDPQRSFTAVNLNIRPPSSLPQPPVEIHSGQNLTYTGSVFDAKTGVQSNFQIMIGPGGSGPMPACRTCICWPEPQYCSSRSSSYCTPEYSSGFCCHSHRLKALIEKQLEHKNRLERELIKERDKLRHMQNEVRLMKAAIARRPSPQLLPKLKTDIEKLREECEKLTAAVDLYSDSQNILPLGETDEEFYRNIYTGQRLQREGSWSCQLCTFRNHPLLNVCEECEMPRISLGTQTVDVSSLLPRVFSNNNASFCTEGGTSTSGSLMTAPLQEP